jgi:hypothetical protein
MMFSRSNFVVAAGQMVFLLCRFHSCSHRFHFAVEQLRPALLFHSLQHFLPVHQGFVLNRRRPSRFSFLRPSSSQCLSSGSAPDCVAAFSVAATELAVRGPMPFFLSSAWPLFPRSEFFVAVKDFLFPG